MTDAANSVCKSLALQQQKGCFEDFQRYHYAKAAQIDEERRAFKADVEQRIERLRMLGAGGSVARQYSSTSNVGRTLDDGLPDIQPSWGAGGDPYEHLRRYVPPSEVPTGASARRRPTVAVSETTCADMPTLDDALSYLRRGATQLDGDNDGKPCEAEFPQ